MGKQSGEMKYFSLKEKLKEDILSGFYQPGDKMPSEYQLVDLFQVSRHTVRKALSILEDEGYVMAVHGKGTFCTERAIHKKESKNIAVVTTYISDYIFPRLIQGINEVLTKEGYSLIFKTTENSRSGETKCLEDVLSKDIDGLIIEPSKSELVCKHPKLYEALDSYEIPYVFIQGIYAEMADKPHILMNDCEGGYLLTKYLIKLGHRHIVGVFKVDDYQGKERHKGYVKALQEANIAYDPDLVVWFHTEDRDKKPINGVEAIMKKRDDVDGIVCYNDQIALSVIGKLQTMGLKVPEDISVTGYDNSSLAQLSPVRITTIAHPQEKLGQMAGKLLLDMIQGIGQDKAVGAYLIEPQLIVGDSCAKRNS